MKYTNKSWLEEAEAYLKARYLLDLGDTREITEEDITEAIKHDESPRHFIDAIASDDDIDPVEDWNWGQPTKELKEFYEKYGKN
jgi:hypothetical protein